MEIVECDQANDGGKIQKDDDEIYVPNWLLEVLAWITRVEMANSALSTASKTFHALCWPKLHGNVKQYYIERLLIGHQIDFQGNSMAIAKIRVRQYMLKVVPIPELPMPDYISGFHEIALRYLDGQILAFIERIVQRCGTIELSFTYDNLLDERSPPYFRRSRIAMLMTTAAQPIRRLMNVLMKNNNKKITLGSHSLTSECKLIQMEVLKKLFSSDTANNTVEQHNLSQLNVDDQQHQQPAAEQQQNLFVFQIKTYSDAFRLKKNCEKKFIQYLKNHFHNATQPFNLFIQPCEKHAEFTLENERTGETLQLYHKRDMWSRFYNFLIRHPSGQGDQWKSEGEKKITQSSENSHSAHICINIDKIADF